MQAYDALAHLCSLPPEYVVAAWQVPHDALPTFYLSRALYGFSFAWANAFYVTHVCLWFCSALKPRTTRMGEALSNGCVVLILILSVSGVWVVTRTIFVEYRRTPHVSIAIYCAGNAALTLAVIGWGRLSGRNYLEWQRQRRADKRLTRMRRWTHPGVV